MPARMTPGFCSDAQRSSRPSAVTRVAITGWGRDRDKANASFAGFHRRFTKPFDPDELPELRRTHP